MLYEYNKYNWLGLKGGKDCQPAVDSTCLYWLVLGLSPGCTVSWFIFGCGEYKELYTFGCTTLGTNCSCSLPCFRTSGCDFVRYSFSAWLWLLKLSHWNLSPALVVLWLLLYRAVCFFINGRAELKGLYTSGWWKPG